MNIVQGNRARSYINNKENIPSFVNLKKQKLDTQRPAGKEIQNTQKLTLKQQTQSRIETLGSEIVLHSSQNPKFLFGSEQAILGYLKSREHAYSVNPEYIASQNDINSRMRSILIDWLVDVAVKFNLLPQSLFLATNVIDRYLSKNQVQRNILQLVGVTALMIVCKFEEIYPPLCQKYVAVCDNAYTKDEIIDMEAKILQSLDFDLTQTSALTLLQHLQLRLKFDAKAFAFARYILENSLLDTLSLKYSNLTLAAGSIYLVNKIFTSVVLTAAFEEATLVSENLAKSCAKDLYQIMQKIDSSNLTALKRKFATPELFETSKYRIERVKTRV